MMTMAVMVHVRIKIRIWAQTGTRSQDGRTDQQSQNYMDLDMGCSEIEKISSYHTQLSRCLPPFHLTTETDAVSETSCFFRIPDDGQTSETK
jgi:hypothetical protein